MTKYLPIILGTVRTDSYSSRVAQWVLQVAQQFDFETEILDLEDFNLPHVKDRHDPVADRWREKVERADGYILVVPEYNHSFPGVLKETLDYAYKEYEGKPALIVGVSDGQYGGVRMMEHLMSLLVGLGVWPIKHVIPIGNVDKIYEAGGPDEKLTEKAQKSLGELQRYAEALKPLRGGQ